MDLVTVWALNLDGPWPTRPPPCPQNVHLLVALRQHSCGNVKRRATSRALVALLIHELLTITGIVTASGVNNVA